MTIGELVHHFLRCLSAARAHYVLYRIVDWNHDLYIYNTMPEHKRIVINTDFSANPNLTAYRTATGAVDTHAVLAIYISHEYARNRDGTATCRKRSHCFIGSSESAGKKNNWKFHTSCLDYLIKKLKKESDEKGGEQATEVVVTTDRCPTQYLCRQNILQIAKYSSKTGNPTLKHMFAVVYRFKGDHDAEGKVVKKGIMQHVKKGMKGGTAWDFYVTSKNKTSFSKPEVTGRNKISQREFHFVAYDQAEYERRNSGEHEGNIVLADMNNSDDAKALTSTNKIYMVAGFPPNVTPSTSKDTEKLLREVLYDIEYKKGDEENNTEFLARIAEEGVSCEKEHARHDFIILDEEGSDPNVFMVELSSKSTDYLEEFLYRAGRLNPPPKARKGLIQNISKWINASSANRLYILRSKDQIFKLYKELGHSDDETAPKSLTVKAMMSDMLEMDLPGADGTDEGGLFVCRSNLPCGCESCLSQNPDYECQSPLKKYKSQKTVRIQQLDVIPQSIQEGCNDGNSDEDETI